MRYDALVLAAVLVGILWWMLRRDKQQVISQRARTFDHVLQLFDAPRISQDDVDFPVLEARYKGWQVKIEPIADHVNVRKIPCLWLLVTVLGRVPFRGSLDFLVRPQNTEFYSPAAKLPERLEVPAGWPQHAILQTDDPAAMPPLARLTPHMALFEDPRMKEMVITPRGVRLVYQLDQATRSSYMVLRQMVFEDFKPTPELTTTLLDAAIAIIEDLRAAAGERQREASR